MTTEASNKKRRKAFPVLNVTASEISPAAELISNNADLLTEILVRLPAKSIIRFKCVSKHWLSLLSDSEFATMHITRSSRPSSISGLYFYTREMLLSVSFQGPCLHLPSLSFLDGVRQRSQIVVEDSCNGLLLCYVKPHGGYQYMGYIVCNPTTKKYTKISERGVHVSNAYLSFDPAKSKRHYKVVATSWSNIGEASNRIIVYSSRSLRWTNNIRLPAGEHFGRGVLWKGAILWLTEDGDFLKRFDVDMGEMKAMKNPQTPRILPSIRNMYFGECGGGLILIQSASWCPKSPSWCRKSPSWCPSRFRILELESDYSGWVVKCQVNLNPLIAQFPRMKCRNRWTSNGYNVLYAVEGENGRGCTLLLATPWKIISYNPKDKTWEVLGGLPQESREFGFPDYVLPFVETVFLE